MALADEDRPEARFLAALHAACDAVVGPDHPATQACAEAWRDPRPARAANAQDLVTMLEPEARDRVLAETHRRMREDLSAIRALLPGGARPGGGVH